MSATVRRRGGRLVAATDSDLESAVERRQFREPLLRRFSYELWVPPLRERRDDIGLLFYHLLGEHLREGDDGDRLSPALGRSAPWVPAALVARLALHDWPGNVRELANVALHFAVRNRDRDRGRIDPELERLLRAAPPARAPNKRPASGGRPEDLKDETIAAAMRAANFSVERAAQQLGVSRAYLYKRIESCEGVVRAVDLTEEQIRAALAQCKGDTSAAASALRVATRALVLQMKRLGLKREKR